MTDQKTWTKPRPNIDADSQPFWDGLARHELLLWTCEKCQTAYWPKCYCINHENTDFAENMSWQPSSGLGRSDGRKAAEAFLDHYNKTGSLRPADYAGVTRNASYFIGMLAAC